MSKDILFLHMGGTIDSEYNSIAETSKVLKRSIIENFIKKNINPYSNISYKTVVMKDSRELSAADLDNMVTIIERTPHHRIIITHGTYTISETARYIHRNLKRKNVTVILTGAMTPLLGFAESDAGFNLGFAMAKVEDLKPGVYVAFNAHIFMANDISKSLITTEGRFTSLKSAPKKKIAKKATTTKTTAKSLKANKD